MDDPLHSHYERNLPHRLAPGSSLFITYRLAGTLPRSVREALEAEASLMPHARDDEAQRQRRKQAFVRYDQWLDADVSGPRWLGLPAVAAIVRESLFYFSGREYTLHAYCIMPNHVHLVLTVAEELTRPFYRVLQAQKRFSATKANQLLHRTGAFWQAESYDHVIHNSRELANVIAYVVNNPVKAGLVED